MATGVLSRKTIEEIYSRYAKEPIRLVTWTDEFIRVIGSEIACLRIFQECQAHGRNPQSGLWVGFVDHGRQDGDWEFVANLRGGPVTESPAPGFTRSDGLGVEE